MFIKERGEGAPMTCRLCKVGIHWYGATDNGLGDVRLEVKLWGLDFEIVRWNKIRNTESDSMPLDSKHFSIGGRPSNTRV